MRQAEGVGVVLEFAPPFLHCHVTRAVDVFVLGGAELGGESDWISWGSQACVSSGPFSLRRALGSKTSGGSVGRSGERIETNFHVVDDAAEPWQRLRGGFLEAALLVNLNDSECLFRSHLKALSSASKSFS